MRKLIILPRQARYKHRKVEKGKEVRFAQVTATLPIAGAHTLYRLQAAGEDESSHSVQLNGKVLTLRAVRMRETHTANCIIIDHFSAFESGLVAPFIFAA
jgi:hypothetical protein